MLCVSRQFAERWETSCHCQGQHRLSDAASFQMQVNATNEKIDVRLRN